MNSAERQKLIREVSLAGNCSHPIRLSGEMVNLETGEVGINSLRVKCQDRRQVVCPSCSYLYRADAWILVATGLVGGKGVPEVVSAHPRLFLTVTAPSFGLVHTIRSGGNCATSSRPSLCRHGRAKRCELRHSDDDLLLGKPLCFDCFDYEGAVLWNASVSRLWSRTIEQLRRGVALRADVPWRSFGTVAQIHYLKVAELQRRGLVHLHVVVRADGPGDIESDPPPWLTAEYLDTTTRSVLGRFSVESVDGRMIRWGSVFDLRDLSVGDSDVKRVASYVAKYATKTTDGSRELAHRFRSRSQIVRLVDDPHFQRLALTSWDVSRRSGYEHLHLDAHAHAFGFTGQLITKSRGYSTTFGDLRAVRADLMKARNTHDPVEGTFHYDGRGYDDPRGSDVAELFFRMQRELREEAAEARRQSAAGSRERSPESSVERTIDVSVGTTPSQCSMIPGVVNSGE